MSKPAHLHVHSHYSLLQALPKIDELVAKAVEYSMPAVALTDNGNLYGAIDFYKACKKKNIKPILGIDGYMAARTRHDKQPVIDKHSHRLILIAKNARGYTNLIKLVTKSNLEGFYYHPRMDLELLKQYGSDLIAIIPFFNSYLTDPTLPSEKVNEVITELKNIFGSTLYAELCNQTEIDGFAQLRKTLLTRSKQYTIPLVATQPVSYMTPDDKQARSVLLSIQNTIDAETRKIETQGVYDFAHPDTLTKEFSDYPEALENISKIIDECNLEIELGVWKFPTYTIESGKTPDEELHHIVLEGVKRRGVSLDETAQKRIDYELKVIKDKGYAPYFLVVYDLLRYAHQHNILTTIRGSVAGSMVTYLAGITNVNPLEYKLPFERFLNPERPSAPDIDMDYADDRRDEMIEYAKQKYGADKVAQIGTFGTMMARGAVRDTARALGFPYAIGDAISKKIPMGSQGFPMTIERALEESPELKEIYKKDEEARGIIDMARKVEGCARHISVHAAGVVISPIPLDEVVPVQLDPKGEGKVITQYDMHSIDESNAGLLKFDFLGIRNLAILADAVSLVKKIDNVDVDIENIPLDDKKTFEMLARGETIGLFQLNGDGMTRFLKELRPSTIHDINAMVALYRPGPMESIPSYIERKHNPAFVTYLDPRMKTILSQSYGVITYQDDVMMIAIHLGGYSWLEADKLRKAMGKKIPEEMEAQKEKLHDGLIKNGMSEGKAQELWRLIEPFAAYGFNKAHAASYGRVAYQTAYMKANFPAIYMTAVLSAESGNMETIAEVIEECRRMAIPVLPPDVNESFSDFTAIKSADSKDSIRFGLATIKNFGEGVSHAIIVERKAHGPFTSISDFLRRTASIGVNRKGLEALIMSGAFDALGKRNTLLANIEKMIVYQKESRNQDNGHTSLFGEAVSHDIQLEPAPDATLKETLAWEKELLGLYISGHPIDTCTLPPEAMTVQRVKQMPEGVDVKAFGVIDSLKPLLTKNNERMYIIGISDRTGRIEAVIFPKVAKEFQTLIEAEKCVGVRGRLSRRNGLLGIIADKMKGLE